jgi:hypothetical protein
MFRCYSQLSSVVIDKGLRSFFKNFRQSIHNKRARMVWDALVIGKVILDLVKITMSVVYYDPAKPPSRHHVDFR